MRAVPLLAIAFVAVSTVVADTEHIEPKEGKLLLTVEAEQVDTQFTLLIPVYVHFSGGKFASQPLLMKGRTGKVQMFLPQEPKDVTINDNWEALIDIAP